MSDIIEGERYQIAFYLNHLKRTTGYAILPHEEIKDYEISVPEQKISIKVIILTLIMFLIYSILKKNQRKRSMMKFHQN